MNIKIYLDNCVFNRPFDDQNHIHVRLESIAKLHIQQRIKEGKISLTWSYILDIENEQNPFHDRKLAIDKWRNYAVEDIEETESLLRQAIELTTISLKSKDALHVASAIIRATSKSNQFQGKLRLNQRFCKSHKICCLSYL